MGKFTDKGIKTWIKHGEHFAMRSDGEGLGLCFPERFAAPVWRLRYWHGGKRRVIVLGSYRDLSLAEARKQARAYRSRVDSGEDVGLTKQAKKKAAVQEREAIQNQWTVNQLADEYFARCIQHRLKHPEVVRRQLDKDIRPHLGKLAVESVMPLQVDAMLQAIRDRGAPTTANDVLRLTQKLFDFAIKRHIILHNPSSAFERSDAGGAESSRQRALSSVELITLFQAMRETPGFTVQNYHAVKLLLLLGVRKSELIGARIEEFDRPARLWRLPAVRTKTGVGITIPLPESAMQSIEALLRLSCSSGYLIPARKAQGRMLPHICENTINVALAKVRRRLPAMEPFTVHDFRRTCRTHLAALGVAAPVAERCLNHKLKGVEGTYNTHDYLPERTAGLTYWRH